MYKLKEVSVKYPQTQFWNDSCSVRELEYALENGAVGATTNPVIVYSVLKNELKDWEDQIVDIVNTDPNMTEDDIAWEMIARMGKEASKHLLGVFEENKEKKGRISFQTNSKYFRSTEKMVKHGLELSKICVNSQIKTPASAAGIKAYEELTEQGVSINATVSFSVAQAVKTAEAVERGLKKREQQGLDTSAMNPVCTLMIGRVDDHMKAYCNENGMLERPEIMEWAGIAVAKEALRIFKERGYRTKVLIAAFRNPHHWSAFIGHDIVLTIPNNMQTRINNSNLEVLDNSNIGVKEDYIDSLLKIEEFKKFYCEDGMAMEDFEKCGPFVLAMKQFLKGYDQLVEMIRSYTI